MHCNSKAALRFKVSFESLNRGEAEVKQGELSAPPFTNKRLNEWRSIKLYILPKPLPFSSLSPCRLPSSTLSQAFMQFHWFSIPIPPSVQAIAACYANSHRLSTTSCPLHCTTLCRRQSVSWVWRGVSIASFGPSSCDVRPNCKPLPNFPQLPVSLCPMYRMVGSSVPFRKLAENKSAGMTLQERRLWCVQWKETALLAGKITREPAGDLKRSRIESLAVNTRGLIGREKVKIADYIVVLIPIFLNGHCIVFFFFF